MCGITGIIRFNETVSPEEIRRMTSSLAHRGPDGEGIWKEKNIAIGHRRLSIIDLETGKQPMCNEDETVWITYNGELYNFIDLREQLFVKGHSFRTRSDTEVIIHAYEEWGDECVAHFRGMFAFAVVDKKKKRIFLARDHLGIKPLVYYNDGHCFAFASEIQALKKINGVRLDLYLQGIDEYLWLQYIPAPRSIFKQVRKLSPAHRMSVSFDGTVSEPEEYWRLEFRPDHRKTEAQWLEELDAVLHDSVRAHLVSDVPFGAFLSGGVDSSAVVAYMAQILERPVKTFSIGFAEKEFNELEYAEAASGRWGTEHHVEVVKPDALGILPDLVKCYGEPFGDSSAIPTYYVSKMARKHVPMVLSGDGGDESFAGYHSYLGWMKYLETTPVPRPLWKKVFAPLAARLFPFRYPPVPEYGENLANWLEIIDYMPKYLRQKLWRKDYRLISAGTLDYFEREYSCARDYSRAHKVQYMDIKTYLPFDILTKVDIASMMNGLEVRTPIADKMVVEFAATMPEALNIRKGPDGEWQGKLLLKKLMERYYTVDFLNRKKKGFAVPLETWFAKKTSFYDEINDRLLSESACIKELFEKKIVRYMIQKNLSGPIWLLLFLEEWLRANKEQVGNS